MISISGHAELDVSAADIIGTLLSESCTVNPKVCVAGGRPLCRHRAGHILLGLDHSAVHLCKHATSVYV